MAMTALGNQHRLKVRVINCDLRQSLTALPALPLQNSKDHKTRPCALGRRRRQLHLHKGTFNNEPWHQSKLHAAPGRVPSLSSVGSHKEPKMSYCPGECHLGNHCKDNSDPGSRAPPFSSSLSVNIFKKAPFLSSHEAGGK